MAVRSDERVRAWRPDVPGVHEVLHAHFVAHAYPAHVHDVWTLLLVDDGCVDYTLGRRRHQAVPGRVTVLPPSITHDGRSAGPAGFDKRVVYVDGRWIPPHLAAAAVRDPSFDDADLARHLAAFHRSLADPHEAETHLALLAERIVLRLARGDEPRDRPDPALARRVRARLDAGGPSLDTLGRELGVHPTHLVRVFRREYGLPPHRYLVARRLERARALLLDGMPVAEVAVATGFYDQSHLTRHFRALLATTPGSYRRVS